MELKTFSFTQARGWSVPELPHVDSPNTLVLAFAAPQFGQEPAPIRSLAAAFPQSHLIGCSSAGEILGTSLHDESVSVAVARFERTPLATAGAPVAAPADSYAAGRRIAEQLLRPDLRGVLVISDGLKVNGSELVRGLNSVLPEGVVVTGGLAGDGSRFESTWVVRNGTPSDGWVSAVGFYGKAVRLGHGSKGGWDVFGPERRITKSDGNVLFELDGKAALPLYKEYLGDRAKELPASALLFPLLVRREDGTSVVRTILAVDETKQSMTFAGDMPMGQRAQLMRANFDRLVEGAAGSAQMTRETARSESACLVVSVSCVGRRLVLGERTEDELESVMEVMPAGSQQVGFYSYGELSPYATGKCDLHNQTMTLTTIAED